MLEITKTNVWGFDAAIRGMRNPLESWNKMDSYPYIQNGKAYEVVMPNDKALMKKLADAGDDHGKFMRMINVTCDITAPLYWWKEFDTYKVGTVANSCSTMHKIQAHEFTWDMFSFEHCWDIGGKHYGAMTWKGGKRPFASCDMEWIYNSILATLNECRRLYLETGDKKYWWQMIQLLPSSYNQKRTVQLNYQVLKHIYHARKNHKLDEWHTFCDWIKTLPESNLITGEE